MQALEYRPAGEERDNLIGPRSRLITATAIGGNKSDQNKTKGTSTRLVRLDTNAATPRRSQSSAPKKPAIT